MRRKTKKFFKNYSEEKLLCNTPNKIGITPTTTLIKKKCKDNSCISWWWIGLFAQATSKKFAQVISKTNSRGAFAWKCTREVNSDRQSFVGCRLCLFRKRFRSLQILFFVSKLFKICASFFQKSALCKRGIAGVQTRYRTQCMRFFGILFKSFVRKRFCAFQNDFWFFWLNLYC